MERYDAGGIGTATPTFDTNQFGNLETTGTLMQFVQSQKRFWDSVGVGGSFLASPLVLGDRIYIGSADQNFYALTMDGKEEWRVRVNGVIPYLAAECNGLLVFPCFDNNIYAVTQRGKLAWVFKTQGKIMTSVFVHEGRVYNGSNDGNMYCIDGATGKEVWRFPTKGPQCNPTIVEGRVLFGHDDQVFYCTNLEGKLLWKFSTPGIINAFPPAVTGGRVFFGNYDQNLYAVDIKTGKEVWQFKTNAVTYAPRYEDGKLFFGGRENKVYCVDINGKLKWTFKTEGIVIHPIPVDGTLYFGCYDNNVYAVDSETGKMKWTFKTNGFVTEITVHKGRIYAGSWDCNLYCLDLEGKLLWTFRSSMGSPSEIAPVETSYVTTAQVTLAEESKEEEDDRYKVQTLGDGVDQKSEYVVKSDYVVKSQYTKSKKVKSMSSGWDD